MVRRPADRGRRAHRDPRVHRECRRVQRRGPWLASLLTELAANRRTLAERIGDVLPGAEYRQPQASYLAWLDLRALPWGDDPAALLVDEAKVALASGPAFGRQGQGFARLNFGCSAETLDDGLSRLHTAFRQRADG